MSKASISLNNSAIGHINSAIAAYDNALGALSCDSDNNNEEALGIKSSIESAKGTLSSLIGEISAVNAKIEQELMEKERRERERERELNKNKNRIDSIN